MNITYIFLVICSLFAACGASVISDEITGNQANTTYIDNIINNTLSGDTTTGDAKYLIRVEYRDTLHDSDLSPEDMELNKKYQAYLQAADDVVSAKALNSPDLQEKIDIMDEKREELH